MGYAFGMRFFVGIYRLIIAFFCFSGTYEGWLLGIGSKWVYFTFETNAVLGLIMLWAGAASLLKGIQPPAWLKGCLTLYIIITGLVAWLILPPADPATTTHLYGMMTSTMVHIIAPILASIDFVLFDPHRRYQWHYSLSWLAYFPFYVAFVVIRAQIWPNAGPGKDPYPYGFIDLKALGWQQFGINIVTYALAFFVMGLLLFVIDRILPKKTPLTVS